MSGISCFSSLRIDELSSELDAARQRSCEYLVPHVLMWVLSSRKWAQRSPWQATPSQLTLVMSRLFPMTEPFVCAPQPKHLPPYLLPGESYHQAWPLCRVSRAFFLTHHHKTHNHLRRTQCPHLHSNAFLFLWGFLPIVQHFKWPSPTSGNY